MEGTQQQSQQSLRCAGEQQSVTLLQVDCAPTPQLALGLTGVQQEAGGHAHSSSTGAHRTGEGAVSEDPEARRAMLRSSDATQSHSSSSLLARSPQRKRSLALTGEGTGSCLEGVSAIYSMLSRPQLLSPCNVEPKLPSRRLPVHYNVCLLMSLLHSR